MTPRERAAKGPWLRRSAAALVAVTLLVAGCSSTNSDNTTTAARGANPAASNFPDPGTNPQGGAIPNAQRTAENGEIVLQQLVYDFLLYTFLAGGPGNEVTNEIACAGATSGVEGYCYGFGPDQDQTWRYAGEGMLWNQFGNASQPGPRQGAVMAAAPKTAGDGVLLVGGTTPGADAALSDTWLLSGGSWSQLCDAESCGIAGEAGMSAANNADTALLFGGITADNASFSNELRAWDETKQQWTTQQVSGAKPSPRAEAAFTFAGPGKGNDGFFLLFGGRDQSGALADTWKLTAQNGKWRWSEVKTNGNQPSARQRAAIAGIYSPFTSDESGAILIGGQSGSESDFVIYSDGWTFNGAKDEWQLAQPGTEATNLQTGGYAAYGIVAMDLPELGDTPFTWVEWNATDSTYLRVTQDNRTDWRAVGEEAMERRSKADPTQSPAVSPS